MSSLDKRIPGSLGLCLSESLCTYRVINLLLEQTVFAEDVPACAQDHFICLWMYQIINGTCKRYPATSSKYCQGINLLEERLLLFFPNPPLFDASAAEGFFDETGILILSEGLQGGIFPNLDKT